MQLDTARFRFHQDGHNINNMMSLYLFVEQDVSPVMQDFVWSDGRDRCIVVVKPATTGTLCVGSVMTL